MKSLIFILLLSFFVDSGIAQIGVGTDSPSDKAIMHLNSSDKGIIIPKLNSGEMSAMTVGSVKPEQGTLVYNTDSNEIYAYYNAEWYSMTPFKKVFKSKPTHKGRIRLSAQDPVADRDRYVAASVPRGGIIMLSGSSIPEGWVLCDGNNGTPDLRERFIVGSGGNNSTVGGGAYALNATGGFNVITLTQTQMPVHNHSVSLSPAGGHSHTYDDIYLLESSNISGLPSGTASFKHNSSGRGNEGLDWSNNEFYYLQSQVTSTEPNHNHTVTQNNRGGGGAHENRPPYYALAFIMRIR